VRAYGGTCGGPFGDSSPMTRSESNSSGASSVVSLDDVGRSSTELRPARVYAALRGGCTSPRVCGGGINGERVDGDVLSTEREVDIQRLGTRLLI
jgi:hypothetical protein